MELAAGILWIFVIAMAMYAFAHVMAAARDARAGLALRGAAATYPAGRGPVRLAGRIRAERLLFPPAGGDRVVAWSIRGGFGMHGDREAVDFAVETPGGAQVPVAAAGPLTLLVAEERDVRGQNVRFLRPDTEVVVHGWLDDAGVLRAPPGGAVVVGTVLRPSPARHLARAAFAVFLMTLTGLVVYGAHVGFGQS